MGTFAIAKRMDPVFAALTTPFAIDDHVSQFAQELGGTPQYLICEPGPWSRQSCCDSNVAKYIETHGGRMLCGYRIWYTEPRYAEAERHAVWTDDVTIRDVSFVDSGETRVVVVADGRGFKDAPTRVRRSFDASDKEALEAYETLERMMPVAEMSEQEAWETMPSYEQWLAGSRSPNLRIEARSNRGS